MIGGKQDRGLASVLQRAPPLRSATDGAQARAGAGQAIALLPGHLLRGRARFCQLDRSPGEWKGGGTAAQPSQVGAPRG
jgi:hypothetical protein